MIQLRLNWKNSKEILGMGGPWIGNLMMEEKMISESSVVDNFLIDEENFRIYFVKYYKVSKSADQNFFAVCYYDIKSDRLNNGIKAFKYLYLDSFEGHSLVIFKAFHNNSPSDRMVISFDEVFNLPGSESE